MFKTIREYQGIELIEGSMMSSGLYRLTRIETSELTLWFDKDEADRLIKLTDEEFYNEFQEMVKI